MLGGLVFRSVVGVGGGKGVCTGSGEMEEAGGADVPGTVGADGILENPADCGTDGGGGEFGVGGHFFNAAPDAGGAIADAADQRVGIGGGCRVSFGDLEERGTKGLGVELMAVETVVGGHDVEGGRSGGVGWPGGLGGVGGFGGGVGQFQYHLLCIDLVVAGVAVFRIGDLYLVGDGGVEGEGGVICGRFDLNGRSVVGLAGRYEKCE